VARRDQSHALGFFSILARGSRGARGRDAVKMLRLPRT